ncbi:uncharacterized protein C8Q71DRAFT_790635 [Rhodofomes roseus]|uniref:F-box domain-containing protein n=1 Tax=Rhodofomes roseus TaxID=34475 RepID=A0ABQ8JZU1_9APHY|nr:uncharacterized protein C8Q71DRAFT_790635 [Rhodofomes roseus]KAH9829362.1 hypothetical protein C8Q71DRAFT_790635 [Rhodofomes roseus]
MRPAGRHGLNEDTWSIVLSFADPNDAHSLSLVSRIIHPAARRVVLSRAKIFSQGQLEHVCAFMLEEPQHRVRWLRELHISDSALNASAEGLAAKLADLLGAAQNIVSLALPCVESMLEAEPRVGTALASLARLEVVKFSGVFAQSLNMANTMASSPTDVTLILGTSWDDEYSTSELPVMLSHLALLRKASVVEIEFSELSGTNSYVRSYGEPSNFGFELGQLGQQPTVREFRFRCGGPLPLFHIFPNMQVLHLRCMEDEFAQFDWEEWAWTDSVPLVEVTTDDNDQLVCLAGAHGTPMLRQLYLDQPPSHDSDVDFDVDSLRPICLTFPLEEWHAPRRTNLPLWGGHLEDPAEGRLRYLQVAAKCHSEEDMPVRWVTWLLPALLASQLVCLRLSFHVTTSSGKVTRLDEARQLLVKHLPSLRYLCIAEGKFPVEDLISAFHPRFVGECAWWRVHEVAGERRSESISCEAGERVERYLRSAEFEKTLSLNGFVLNDA